ncbi:MAG TPA: S-methyl-5'-thioinosine phosphorylase [Caldisericia bacterium]|nr:S-methyl-5'-thioinosine phosphorylase [Caldisericia bacterium]HPF48981.1 S-methyl-5'-thioinosine phosphorylase [Caldisericia bacterium]HPI83155.1 S-methyl-5'-thioinosine phosphorylase [Caldisericia bacterium]HPQ92382.1 S-methyl-5'-thioinosine phosphorylase [Caldisericia bacterium]HRV74520.1 S-methyl-5'-thioinosine phosphorylase [Caldisericia bacterium]
MVGIIGGSGVYNLPWLEDSQEQVVDTRYGESVVKVGYVDGLEVAFITRHGKGHKTPPQAINYRANLLTLSEFGVTDIVSTYAVGAIDERMQTGDFVIPTQFIDFTSGRASSFFDEPGKVLHVDVTEPYSKKIREHIQEAMVDANQLFFPEATYVCTNGPRYETPAEIKMFSMLGGSVVGMTGVPEVVLAAELGIPFASIAVVTNMAAGISKNKLTHQEVMDIFSKRIDDLSNILRSICQTLSVNPSNVNPPEAM